MRHTVTFETLFSYKILKIQLLNQLLKSIKLIIKIEKDLCNYNRETEITQLRREDGKYKWERENLNE